MELPTSTAHRLAKTDRRGFPGARRRGRAATGSGRRSRSWASSFHRRGLHRIAPELAELARVTSATVDLAVRNNRRAQVILSGGSLNRDSGVGLRRPLHSTALGKVLLAWDPEGKADLAALGPLPALTGRTIVDHGELRAELDRVREAGYALNDGESGDGIRTVGAVLDRLNHVRYAGRALHAAGHERRADRLVRRAHAGLRAGAGGAPVPPAERRPRARELAAGFSRVTDRCRVLFCCTGMTGNGTRSACHTPDVR